MLKGFGLIWKRYEYSAMYCWTRKGEESEGGLRVRGKGIYWGRPNRYQFHG